MIRKPSEIILSIILGFGLIVLLLWGCPVYNVYRMKKKGEASLANANYSRQVRIVEARSVKESATLLAEADTLRAHGTARTNEIINRSITPEFLQWMWIENLKENNNTQYIYVPSGNLGLPVTEATRFNKPVTEEK